MDTVALVTDSSACLEQERTSVPMEVVPIVIHLPDGDVRGDGPDAAGRVYEALRHHESVKSSAPTAVEYVKAIEDTDADAVVVITPATEFTTMYRNATLAADLSDRPVAVVDSRTAAAAHGLVVERAARAAESGGSVDDVVQAAEDASARAELVAALESLEHIRRSGRVPLAALGLARHLGVRPVFRLRLGTVERLGVPRSPKPPWTGWPGKRVLAGSRRPPAAWCSTRRIRAAPRTSSGGWVSPRPRSSAPRWGSTPGRAWWASPGWLPNPLHCRRASSRLDLKWGQSLPDTSPPARQRL